MAGYRLASMALALAFTLVQLLFTATMTGESLSDYLEEMKRENAKIAAARRKWMASLQESHIEGSLPDPKLSLKYFKREIETRVGPQEWSVALSQRIPGRGKLSAKASAALSKARIHYWKYVDTLLSRKHELFRLYAEYFYLARSIEVSKEIISLVQDLEKVALTAYKADRSSYDNVLTAQIEVSKIRDRLASMQDRGSSICARIEGLLNRDRISNKDLPWPSKLPETETLPEEAVLLRALEKNPKFLMNGAAKQRAKSSLRWANRSDRPDLTLGIQYISTDEAGNSLLPESGKDPLILNFAVNLPLNRGKYRAMRKRAKSQLRSAEREEEQRLYDLRAALEEALFQWRDGQRRSKLYQRHLIPSAEQALKVARREFVVDGSNFPTLVDNERNLYEYKIALERAKVDSFIAQSKISTLCNLEGGQHEL